MPSKLKLILKVARQYILAIILMILAFIANLNTFLSRILPQLPSSTPAVALIYESRGDANFRNAFDTIWLPVPTKALLYSGDYIRTGKGGSAKVTLNPTKDPTQKKSAQDTSHGGSPGATTTPESDPDTVELTEETFVRITMERGSFKIKLMSGDVTVKIKNPDTKVYIQKGSDVKEAEDSEKTVAEKIDNTNRKDAPEQELPKDIQPLTEEEKETEEAIKKEIAFKTIPRNSLVLLFMSDQNYKFRFANKCINACTLKLWRGQNQVAEASFKNGEEIVRELPVNSSTFGSYRWQVTTNNKTYDGGFDMLAYNKDNVNKSLSEKADVEVNF
jgi:hypothetical protein